MTGVSSAARRLSMWLVLITLVAAVAEGGAFVALRAIKHSPARFLVWDPDLTQLPKIWADAAGQWDEDLGWPAPRDATAPPRDHTGAKLNTDFPDPGTACAAAYGDFLRLGRGGCARRGLDRATVAPHRLPRLELWRVGLRYRPVVRALPPQHRRGSTGGDARHLCRERCAQRCRLPLVPRPGAASTLAQGTVPARHRGRARVVGTAETRRCWIHRAASRAEAHPTARLCASRHARRPGQHTLSLHHRGAADRDGAACSDAPYRSALLGGFLRSRSSFGCAALDHGDRRGFRPRGARARQASAQW